LNKTTESNPAGGVSGLALNIPPDKAVLELSQLLFKIGRGVKRLSEFSEDELAIATAPKQEILASDMVRLYRYVPVVEKPLPIPVLIVYALIGRYQMIDLETDRSFVRKLLAHGLDVYMVDWGLPKRAQRWLTIDDYVNGYLDECVEAICAHHDLDKINLLGVCQGGVFSTCYAALHPERVKNLILTVTPLNFHGDAANQETGSGYVNLWTRAMKPEDADLLVDTLGSLPGPLVGFAFLMMNPVSNITKYTTELINILDDDKKLLNFLHMETWIADRPTHPGEVARQWFKDLYQGNKLIKNELMLGKQRVDLRNITMPVLNVYAEGDVIVPTSCSGSLEGRFGTEDYRELPVPGGHIGTFVGGKAQKILAPTIVDWLKARS
jgi:poly[(R)-3-hydroxyalkanoate] polymerase subunit PhaC